MVLTGIKFSVIFTDIQLASKIFPKIYKMIQNPDIHIILRITERDCMEHKVIDFLDSHGFRKCTVLMGRDINLETPFKTLILDEHDMNIEFCKAEFIHTFE